MKNEKEFVYKSTVRHTYGLTPSMIDELGEPDRYVDNPHYKTGPPASLYRIDRVETWIEENQERVDKARASRARRSAAQLKLWDERRKRERQEAMDWVHSVPVTTTKELPNDLLDATMKRFGLTELNFAKSKALRATVRHERTNYNDLLHQMKQFDWRLQPELYQRLRKRVDAVVEDRLADWKAKHDPCEVARLAPQHEEELVVGQAI